MKIVAGIGATLSGLVAAALFISGMVLTMSGSRVCAKYGNPPSCLAELDRMEVVWASSLIPMAALFFFAWLYDRR